MKLNQLTFTRFLAALAILIFHSNHVWPFNTPLLHQVFANANAGVSYFFILSGFVMIIAYGKDKTKKIDKDSFYLNRVARIYPVYLIALLFTVTAIYVKAHDIDLTILFAHLLGIQAWLPGSALTLNKPAWSVSVEVLFYLSFPLLFNNVYRRFSFKSVTIAIISFWLVTQVVVNVLGMSSFYKGYPSPSHDFLFYFPLIHLNGFLVGNLLGFAYLKVSHVKKNFDLPVLALFAALVVLLSQKSSLNYHDGLMAVFFAPLILLLSLNTGRITQVFSNKYLMLLGEVSYTMYILQLPFKLITNFVCRKLHLVNEVTEFYVYVAILLSASICCYHFIEVPARDFIKGLGKQKAKAPMPVAPVFSIDNDAIETSIVYDKVV